MKQLVRSLFAAAVLLVGLSSCQKADNQVGLLSFSFKSSLNPALSQDVTADIDAASKTLTMTIPSDVAEQKLIPSFTVTEYDKVTYGSSALVSGTSSAVFTDGSSLTVTDPVSDMKLSYTLKVQKNDNLAELVSVVFKNADNELLDADVAPDAIASEMIVRVPEKAFQQKLTMSVSAGFNDVIKVNGTSVASGSSLEVDTNFPIDIVVSDEIAKQSKSYVVKVGKILGLAMKKVAIYSANASYAVMKVNPKDGLPYISFDSKRTGDSYDQASVVKWNGNSFEFVGDAGFTGGGTDKKAYFPYLSFDNNGVPAVAYLDGKNNSSPTVAKYENGSWTIVGSSVASAKKANTTYEPGFAFAPGSNAPYVFFSANTKSDSFYRTMGYATFNGSWSEAIMPGIPSVNGTDGVYIRSRAAVSGSSLFVLSVLNGSEANGGYYIHKLDAGSWSTLKGSFLTMQHTSCISLKTAADGSVYAMLAVKDNDAYPVGLYKVDPSTGDLKACFGSVALISGSARYGAYQDFGINPVSGQIIACYAGITVGDNALTDSAPYFRYLDSESGTWTDPVKFGNEKVGEQICVEYAPDGTGYVCVVDSTDKSIVLYKIGLEDDVLPE